MLTMTDNFPIITYFLQHPFVPIYNFPTQLDIVSGNAQQVIKKQRQNVCQYNTKVYQCNTMNQYNIKETKMILVKWED